MSVILYTHEIERRRDMQQEVEQKVRETFSVVDLPLFELVDLVTKSNDEELESLNQCFGTAKAMLMAQITAGENKLRSIGDEYAKDNMEKHFEEYRKIEELVLQSQFVLIQIDYKLEYLQAVKKSRMN